MAAEKDTNHTITNKNKKEEEKEEDSHEDDMYTYKPTEDSRSNEEHEVNDDAEHENVSDEHELNEYPKFTTFSPQILTAYTEIVKERIGPQNTTVNHLRRELHLFGSVMSQFNHLLFEEVEQMKSDIDQIKLEMQEMENRLNEQMSAMNNKLDQLLHAFNVSVSNESASKPAILQTNDDNNV